MTVIDAEDLSDDEARRLHEKSAGLDNIFGLAGTLHGQTAAAYVSMLTGVAHCMRCRPGGDGNRKTSKPVFGFYNVVRSA